MMKSNFDHSLPPHYHQDAETKGSISVLVFLIEEVSKPSSPIFFRLFLCKQMLPNSLHAV